MFTASLHPILAASSGFEWIVPVILVIVGASTASLRGAGPTLVLTKFLVSRSPADGKYIQIAGRPQGLIGFILRLFGLTKDTTLEVKADRTSKAHSSVAGKSLDVAPHTQVASTHCGFTRNTAHLVLAILFLVSATVLVLGNLFEAFGRRPDIDPNIAAAVTGVLAVVFFVAFLMSSTMFMSVRTSGASDLRLKFKAGTIEAVSVDLTKVEDCIRIINHLVSHAQTSARQQQTAATEG